ncbi:MAG: GAF domain-containing protein, partial [Chloroflexota bacterium]
SQRMLGYSYEEMLHRSIFEFLHPDLVNEFQGHFADLLAHPIKPSSYEGLIRHKNGSWRWVEAIATNLASVSSIGGIVVNYRDITERKESEEAARQNIQRAEILVRISERLNSHIDLDELLQTICIETASALEARAAGIYLFDPKTNKLYLHASHGLSEREKNLSFSAPLEDFERLAANAGPAGVIEDPAGLFSDGSEDMEAFRNSSVLYATIRGEESFIGVLGAVIEKKERQTGSDLLLIKGLAGQAGTAITNARIFDERKRMNEDLERRLRESQVLSDLSRALNETLELGEIFRMIVEAVLVLLPNVDSAVIHLVDQANQTLRAEARAGEEKAQAPDDEMNLPLDRGLAGWVYKNRKAIKVGNVLEEPLYLSRGSASQIRSIVVVPVQNKEKFYGTLSVNSHEPDTFSERDEELINTLARNASIAIANADLYNELREKYRELQRIQTRLVQSEKLVSLGQLLSGIAHELNNPLTTILLSSQMLRQRIPPDLEEDALQLEKESLRTVNLVRGLLDFARQRPIRRDPLDIAVVLEESLKLTKSQMDLSAVRLETKVPADLPLVMGDPYQLQQVFINLINNACQSIAELKRPGALRICVEIGRSRLETEKRNVFVRVVVGDTGPGIRPEVLPFLFEPFFTTKTEGNGTGLGLPIAHGIVTQHQGHIWAESLPGEGARFYIEIPVAETAGLPPQISRPTPRGATGSLRTGDILIVDDEIALTSVLRMALERKGYRVDVAHHAAAALEKIGKHCPSLILCDMHLKGVTGVDLYSKFRESAPDAPIVFITGDTLDNGVRAFLEKTRSPYLIKPFELSELTDKINEVFSQREA